MTRTPPTPRSDRGPAAVGDRPVPGIIGPADDPQVVCVASALRRRGADPTVLDLGRFPQALRLSLRDGAPAADGLDLAAVGAWYVRSLPLPLPFRVPEDAGPDRRRHDYAAGRERRSFLSGFTSALAAAGAELVNPPDRMAQHFRKPEQLDALRAAGVPVPPTLATNDPEALAGFVREVGAVVFKPLAGGGRCRRLAAADLTTDRLALLSAAPVLFQAEVPGTNIRGYVVDGAVVAAYEITSDELDYRGAEVDVRPVRLTAAETDACRRAAAACGMPFTGLDLRRRPDGGFAVLECNPSPMFAGIQRRTGAEPVSDALAGFLLAGAGRAPRRLARVGTAAPSA
jgi:glutathione synthase/RimK-type ligase-like ATP-grasp enzyme